MEGDLIVGTYSGFIALLALIFAGYQTILSRKHNRLSVEPHLNINYVSDSGKMCFELENNGIVQAKIKTYSILRLD